ncbi:hypothetical protein CPLU01_14747 [Colletotrichum plurivorum]|uniref:Uncharacterized protein n=1 Tax=Colletotrichum plurivorum TaxID=2175906 RepID=A0A8H6JH33_9PEZI|nr:hypothetical protein CPLU01_14747 [Colletotrichum plurivorum]
MYSAVPLSAPECSDRPAHDTERPAETPSQRQQTHSEEPKASNVSKHDSLNESCKQYAQISDIEIPSHEKDDHAPDAKPESSILAVWWMEIWTPLPGRPSLISINSLIAIFTALFKASLIFPVAEGLGQLKWKWFNRPQKLNDLVLFDNASRGPWGSLLLLVKVIPRPQRGYLAALGALITVAALAIDPFSQAIVNHKGCEIVANFGRATVSRANNYSTNGDLRFDTYGKPIPITNAEMLAAINRGLVDPPKAAEFIGFDCTSGNCTFEQDGGGAYFSSLAMCHSCKDISQEVVKIFEMGPRTYNTNYYIPWSEDIEGGAVGKGVSTRLLTVAETPSEMHRNDTSPPVHSFDLLALNKYPVLKGSKKTTEYRPLAGVYTEEEHGDALLLKRRPTVSRLLEGNETSFGLVTDSILVDGEERKCKPAADGAENIVRVGFRNGSFREVANIVPDFKLSKLPYNLTWQSYPQECVWFVEKTAWTGISWYLRSLLEGRVTTPLEDYDFAFSDGPFWHRRLFSEGNITVATVESAVAGIAASITATMRKDPYGSNNDLAGNASAVLKEATGRVMVAQTCIYVEWGWIAYPASILALQWAFLAMIFVACGRRSAGWESSPLPLLFHGLDEDLRSRERDIDSIKEMLDVSERTKVQLAPVEDSRRSGWRFVDS